MEKLLVLPASRSKMVGLKAFLAALTIDFKSIPAKEEEKAEITDPYLIRRIENYEQGNPQPVEISLEKLKAILHA